MSTVGFGDFNPRSNVERLFTAAMLVVGVAVVSYLMGNLLEIIGQMGEINDDFNDGDKLTKFFGLLSRFNHDKPV
jgi:hypothetical protein